MDERESGLDRRVLEVGVVLLELLGQKHPLVDEGLEREAGNVPVLRPVDGGHPDLVVGPLPDDVELPLEGHLVEGRVPADEDLPDERLGGLGRLSQRGIVGRHRPPADERLALGLDDLLEALLDSAALDPVAGEEDQAGPVLAGLGKGDPGLLADLLEEGVGNLDEDAGAVAGVRLAAGRAAVVEVLEDLDRLLQDPVGLAALDVDDEADAAGVVLEPRVVKPLLGRPAGSGPAADAGIILVVLHEGGGQARKKRAGHSVREPAPGNW